MAEHGISAFAYCRETLADARRNGVDIVKQIQELTYQIIFVDPEHLIGKEWRLISTHDSFRTNVLYGCVDEVHLVNEWGADFRVSFKLIGKFFRGESGKDFSPEIPPCTAYHQPPSLRRSSEVVGYAQCD